MKLNCVVVDDSSIQRIAMVKMIEKHPNLNLIGEFNNAIETKAALSKINVDLIFLDIEMPVLSGFDLLDDLENKPGVIFVTGKTHYAFKAFNYDAIDYLQKPIMRDRFLYSVEKALLHHKMKNVDQEEGEHIFVKSNLKKHKVFLNDIVYIEALGDYVKIICAEYHLVVLSTMKSFEERLPEDQFMRVHKSYLINLQRVDNFNSKFINMLDTDMQIPLSRNKKKDLTTALTPDYA
ncbi:MAG: LytTR family DNA-binding domain-containing protein [Flavobacteriaceae bacterium]|nr:LytTR family DNA-binding domain-containing protein [Flavobacteriaceae bacterium]